MTAPPTIGDVTISTEDLGMNTKHTQWNDFELNLFTLSFAEAAVEKDFKDQHFAKSLRHVRVAMLIAIGFFGIFGVLDAWIVPEVKYQLWYIRYGIFCPFVVLMLLFSYNHSFKKYMQICIASIVALAGFGTPAYRADNRCS